MIATLPGSSRHGSAQNPRPISIPRAARGLLLPLVAGLMLGMVGCGGGGGSSDRPGTPEPPAATVEGPVAGNHFISATSFPLNSVGYRQAEYFVAGTAHSYVAQDTLGSDGLWQVSSADAAAYKTRIVVYRPIDAADSTGR
jgi:hypothetical protein